MIIVLKKDEAKEKIEVVKKAFDGKKQVFVHETALPFKVPRQTRFQAKFLMRQRT